MNGSVGICIGHTNVTEATDSGVDFVNATAFGAKPAATCARGSPGVAEGPPAARPKPAPSCATRASWPQCYLRDWLSAFCKDEDGDRAVLRRSAVAARLLQVAR